MSKLVVTITHTDGLTDRIAGVNEIIVKDHFIHFLRDRDKLTGRKTEYMINKHSVRKLTLQHNANEDGNDTH